MLSPCSMSLCLEGDQKAIHETFQQGMLVLVGEPRNYFPLEDADDTFILVAGGIGVTPILAMARELRRLERTFEVALLHPLP